MFSICALLLLLSVLLGYIMTLNEHTSVFSFFTTTQLYSVYEHIWNSVVFKLDTTS